MPNQCQKRAVQIWVGVAALFAIFACGATARAGVPGEIGAYRLAPGDRITVTVVGQGELSGDYAVDGAGNIVFPLVGSIEVRNLTVTECEHRIVERLADGILVQPSVAVRSR